MSNDLPFAPMTPGELRGVLADLGLSNDDAAQLIGVAKSTLAHWLVGPVPFGPAVILLRLLRADAGLTAKVKAAAIAAGAELPPRKPGRPPRQSAHE